jgi:glucans biosynthesis protein
MHWRTLLSSLLLAAAGFAATAAQAAVFGFDDVAREAQVLARGSYRPPPTLDAQRAGLSYDAYRRIRFRESHSLWRGRGTPFEMQFFPLARETNRSLRLFEIVDGRPRRVAVPASAFIDQDGVLPPETSPQAVGVAGWRLTYPLNEAGKRDEVIAFLGASYFRALGAGQRYGLSARALAVDTVGGRGEEFPDFTAFWFEPPGAGARELVFYALLDGPRVTGAYRFVLRPGVDSVVEVKARLYLRAPLATLGIAPLTSMFLHGENQPRPSDFRPEVHDSDGLQIEGGDGEWIWRPLTNPHAPFVTSFGLRSPRGFGLMQRDRAFANYEDIEAGYERRPSAWVEPVGDWGPGRVELLQFHTPDETHDNVAAYWVPAQLPAPGQPIDLAWRLHWQGDAARVPPAARAVQTRIGHGYVDSKRPLPPGRHQVVIDFAGPGLPPASTVETPDAAQAVATGSANARLVRVNAYPNPARSGWRVTVEFDRLDKQQPVELRVFLRQGVNTVSETWSYALAPEPLEKSATSP